ncbi:MAG: M56 family metallopeptidase [Acidobacteriota bacterium]|nr:M56 family metallopeptidase [Acidobacteriota bacterium]
MNAPLWLRDLAAVCFQIAVIVIAGTILPCLFRLSAPKIRLIYWQALLGACLLLPLIQPWRPEVPGPVVVSISSALVIPATAAPATASVLSIPWPAVILVVLLAGVAIRLLWLCLGLGRLRAHRRDSLPAADLLSPVVEAQRLVPAKAHVLIARTLSSPAAFGFRHPAVLLPERFLSMPPGQQKAIACHEFLHIRRRDWAWTLTEEIIFAAFWFHPAIWWLIRNIRLSREQTVDAEVVRLTASRADYLEGLLTIARLGGQAARSAPSLLIEGQLAARVSLLVKEVHMSRRKQAAICILSAVVLLATGRAAVWAFPLDSQAKAQNGAATASRGQGELVPQVELFEVVEKGVGKIYNVDPKYPEAAVKAKIQGTVVADVSIGRQGNVTNVRTLGGPEILDEAVITALKQWRFKPDPLLPARTTVRVDFRFRPKSHIKLAVSPPGIHAQFNPASGLKLINHVFVVYPPLARVARLQGNVVLRITVDKDGTVSNTDVLSGHPLLIKAALEAVREWKFSPPANAPVTTNVTFTFRVPPPARVPSTNTGPASVISHPPPISKIYAVGEDGVEQPMIWYAPSPVYPSAAKKAKVSGNVVFSVVVAPDGAVAWLKEISKPMGMGIDESAEKSVRTWKFWPGMVDGKAVAVKMTVVVTFNQVGGPNS